MRNTITINLKRENGKHLDSIIIPSKHYPVSSAPEMFHTGNTKETEDDQILRVFDSIPFRPGYCFSSADELVRKLKAAGYDATYYCGWMFMNPYEYPTHHAWAVINGTMLLDVTDLTDMLRGYSGSVDGSEEQMRETFIEQILKRAETMKNSERIKHPGLVPLGHLYCGSPDTMEHSMETDRTLKRVFPNHKSFVTVGSDHLTDLQREYYSRQA